MTRMILIILAFLSGLPFALAHEVRPAYLEMRETLNERYSVLWRIPAAGDMRLAVYLRLPGSCTTVDTPAKSIEGGAYVERWAASCPGGLKGKEITIDGLGAASADALVRITHLSGATETLHIKANVPSFTVAGTQSIFEVAMGYAVLGVEHILFGIDHLLFVLALLLLKRDMRALILTITAFTAAHSITLSGAALGYLSLPQTPVEVLIAASIVFVAAELVKARHGEPRLSETMPWLVAFPFGLLHGFGFAGALSEIGLPQTDVPVALLAFNVGVEFGQLLFVGAVLILWDVLKRIITIPVHAARMTAAYGIGSIAAVWMLERIGSLA